MKRNKASRMLIIGRVYCIVLIIATLLILTASLYAAYISRGNYKDVLISGSYHFESNILRADEAAAFTCYSTSQQVTVFNYGSGNETNSVDVTYDITFAFDGTVNTHYDYFIQEDGETAIALTSGNTVSFTNKTLAHSVHSMHTYTISYTNTEPGATGITDTAGIPTSITVTATPTEPDFMAGGELQRTVSFSSNQVSVSGSFAITGTDITDNNYAGFIYRISKSGSAAVDQIITVTWDAYELTLSANTVLPDGVTPIINGETGTLTFPYTASIESLTFFRVMGDDPDTTDITEGFTQTTAAGLNGLVTISTSVSPSTP